MFKNMAYIVIFSIFVSINNIDMRRIKYYFNQEVGNFGIKYLKELPKQGEKRKALFECHCGKMYESVITNVRENKSTSCGCNVGERHGMKGTNEYNIWQNIKNRCYNSNNPRYKDYGGRGIKMDMKWFNSFTLFYSYISCLPKEGEERLTIDRIDNDGGYFRGNLRWATYKQQRNNQRKNT